MTNHSHHHQHQPTSKPSSFYANVMLWILIANIPLCFAMIGLLLLIPIGAWQVIDALYWLLMGDKRRRPYIVVVLFYFVVCFGLTMLQWNSTGILLSLIIVPYAIAFWYWFLTWEHAQEAITVSGGALDEDSINRNQPQI